jgi:hypothetical protein
LSSSHTQVTIVPELRRLVSFAAALPLPDGSQRVRPADAVKVIAPDHLRRRLLLPVTRT